MLSTFRCRLVLTLVLGLFILGAARSWAAEEQEEGPPQPRTYELDPFGPKVVPPDQRPDNRKYYADVLARPQDMQAVPLAAGDTQAAELWRRLEAAQPGLRLPLPVGAPQVLRLLNEEMTAQGLAWEVRLHLDLAPGEHAPPAHDGVLLHGLPPHAGLQQALATGSLAQMLRALADCLHATLTPCAGGKLLLVQGPSPLRLDAPLGTVRPLAELRRDFADVLRITNRSEPYASFALPVGDARIATMVRRLREVKLTRIPPRPALLSQMLRFLNAEMARQQVPYEVCLDVWSGEGARSLDRELYDKGASFEPRPDGEVTVGSCLAWLENLNKGMLLCTDGRRILVMQGAESWFNAGELVEDPAKRGP